MNKYVLAMVALGFLGFHGFQRLKQSYQLPFDSAESEVAKNLVNKGALNKETENDRIEIFYYLSVDRFADGEKSNNASVQVKNPVGFHGGDLKGVINNFDYIKSLGVTSLLLDSLTKQREKSLLVKGPDGGTYNHFAFSGQFQESVSFMDPRYGTKEELLHLISLARSNNIKTFMVMDLKFLMFNSPLSQERPSLFLPKDSPTCSSEAENLGRCSYVGRRAFDFNNPEAIDYALNVVKNDWARLGLNGVFLKRSSFIEEKFISTLRKRLQDEIDKDFKVVSLDHRPERKSASEYIYHSEFPTRVENFINGEDDTNSFISYVSNSFSNNSTLDLAPLKSERVPSLTYLFGNDLRINSTNLGLILALGAGPIINFGEEVGKNEQGMPRYKTDFPWGDKQVPPGADGPQDKWLLGEFKRLISLRKNRPSLFKGSMTPLSGDFPDKTFCFSLQAVGSINSLSCFNYSGAPKTISLEAPAKWKSKTTLKDYFNNKEIKLDSQSLSIHIQGYGAAILAP